MFAALPSRDLPRRATRPSAKSRSGHPCGRARPSQRAAESRTHRWSPPIAGMHGRTCVVRSDLLVLAAHLLMESSMLKRMGTFAAAVVALAACSGGSPTGPTADLRAHDLAPSFAPHDEPGTPGDPNCRGQTNAFLAQASKRGDIPPGFRGLGGVSRATGLTVQEIQAIVDAFCNPPPGP
jgi:hypothetical protein